MAEFDFDIKPLFPESIIKLTANFLCGQRNYAQWTHLIDQLGMMSAQAQQLLSPITTGQRFMSAPEQELYMAANTNLGCNGAVIGLIKSGSKNLFLSDRAGVTRYFRDVPCVLDFYIHESQQRRGLGKLLFQRMLGEQQVATGRYAIDRPSDKMLAFLKKHYGLANPINQANNFVVFDDFFENGNGSAEPEQEIVYKMEDHNEGSGTGNRHGAKPSTHAVSNFLGHL